MEDPTPCGGIFHCPNGTECRGEWEVSSWEQFSMAYPFTGRLIFQTLSLRKRCDVVQVWPALKAANDDVFGHFIRT